MYTHSRLALSAEHISAAEHQILTPPNSTPARSAATAARAPLSSFISWPWLPQLLGLDHRSHVGVGGLIHPRGHGCDAPLRPGRRACGGGQRPNGAAVNSTHLT